MGKRNKYKVRADGRRETTKTYTDFGPSLYCGKKHFYGKTDEDVDKQISDFDYSAVTGAHGGGELEIRAMEQRKHLHSFKYHCPDTCMFRNFPCKFLTYQTDQPK